MEGSKRSSSKGAKSKKPVEYEEDEEMINTSGKGGEKT